MKGNTFLCITNAINILPHNLSSFTKTIKCARLNKINNLRFINFYLFCQIFNRRIRTIIYNCFNEFFTNFCNSAKPVSYYVIVYIGIESEARLIDIGRSNVYTARFNLSNCCRNASIVSRFCFLFLFDLAGFLFFLIVVIFIAIFCSAKVFKRIIFYFFIHIFFFILFLIVTFRAATIRN